MRTTFKSGRLAGAWLCALVWGLSLSACGGGGGGGGARADVQTNAQRQEGACSLTSQKVDLRAYMRDQYYFNNKMPDPDPAGFGSIDSYFYALLYEEADRSIASDHWSFVLDTDLYDRYFVEGQDLGYGLHVASAEQDPGDALRIHSVDAGSPAALAGLKRGQIVTEVNGQPGVDVKAEEKWSDLFALAAGETLSLKVQDSAAAAPRVVTLTAASYKLSPVPQATVLTTPQGKKVGYVRLDAFIQGAEKPLMDKLASFAGDASVSQDALILDLRYDGGGALYLAQLLASEIVGAGHKQDVFASVQFNAQQAQRNEEVPFVETTSKGWRTLYVLSGPETCSASELVINSLKPYINVVQIGGTTCGKPFGFEPVESSCSNKVFSAVEFELFNGLGEGRYYEGIAPQCQVPDDMSREPGDAEEGLTAAALNHADSGACAVMRAGLTARGAQAATAVTRRQRGSLRNSLWLAPPRP